MKQSLNKLEKIISSIFFIMVLVYSLIELYFCFKFEHILTFNTLFIILYILSLIILVNKSRNKICMIYIIFYTIVNIGLYMYFGYIKDELNDIIYKKYLFNLNFYAFRKDLIYSYVISLLLVLYKNKLEI